MKIEIKKIGLIDRAELSLTDLTIICGENNTGKTYVTYAIYGFLQSWRNLLFSEMGESIAKELRASQNGCINLSTLFSGKVNEYLARIAKNYVSMLPNVFSAEADLFTDAEMLVSIENEFDVSKPSYHRVVKGINSAKTIATIQKIEDSPMLEVLVSGEDTGRISYSLVSFVCDAIADIIFAPHLPSVFIASAERTGAAIFRKELDFARTRLIEILGRPNPIELRNPFELVQTLDAGYPWPVQHNVDFVRQLEDMDKQTGLLAIDYPEINSKFEEVIGGSYKVIKGKGLCYQPKGSGKPRLKVSESSSSVRALLDIGFYLRCRAKPGDLFMIDEPELNLHPVNQRAFARLVAYLVNCGLKIYMTTHSDYIIKEINTLIMLNAGTTQTKKIEKKHGYNEQERLNPGKISLFMTCSIQERREGRGKRAKYNSLRKANIDPRLGIEVETFDRTIELMNEIQSDIVFGAES